MPTLKPRERLVVGAGVAIALLVGGYLADRRAAHRLAPAPRRLPCPRVRKSSSGGAVRPQQQAPAGRGAGRCRRAAGSRIRRLLRGPDRAARRVRAPAARQGAAGRRERRGPERAGATRIGSARASRRFPSSSPSWAASATPRPPCSRLERAPSSSRSKDAQDPGGGGRATARAAHHRRRSRVISCPRRRPQAQVRHRQERLARVATPARRQRAGGAPRLPLRRRDDPRARHAAPPPASLGVAAASRPVPVLSPAPAALPAAASYAVVASRNLFDPTVRRAAAGPAVAAGPKPFLARRGDGRLEEPGVPGGSGGQAHVRLLGRRHGRRRPRAVHH